MPGRPIVEADLQEPMARPGGGGGGGVVTNAEWTTAVAFERLGLRTRAL
jgi:hypothetical protein